MNREGHLSKGPELVPLDPPPFQDPDGIFPYRLGSLSMQQEKDGKVCNIHDRQESKVPFRTGVPRLLIGVRRLKESGGSAQLPASRHSG